MYEINGLTLTSSGSSSGFYDHNLSPSNNVDTCLDLGASAINGVDGDVNFADILAQRYGPYNSYEDND